MSMTSARRFLTLVGDRKRIGAILCLGATSRLTAADFRHHAPMDNSIAMLIGQPPLVIMCSFPLAESAHEAAVAKMG
jgi:hypothetical protein